MDNLGSKQKYNTPRLVALDDDTAEGRGMFDIPFALLTVLLLTIGVVMVLSASFASAYYDLDNKTGGNATYYFTRQLTFALGGVGVMYIFSKFPLSFYRRTSFIVLGASIFLLVLVLLIGVKSGTAKRWINLGFTTLQPSEITKLAVILSFSSMICRYRDKMKTFRYGIVPFAAILVIIAVLLVLEPHFSATIIIFAVGAVLMFVGGAKLHWFVGGLSLMAVLGFVVIKFFPYASSRITVWLDPLGADAKDEAWQIIQSLYAVGSGGLLGVGLGQSRQKYLYLPEEHNDFIFAVVCEELGFIGAALILALFAMLIIRGYWLALHARDRYGSLVCTGITTLLAIQVILNVAVVTNLVPCTGISLPFFSYGGTALLIQLAEMGIILSISRDIPGKKPG